MRTRNTVIACFFGVAAVATGIASSRSSTKVSKATRAGKTYTAPSAVASAKCATAVQTDKRDATNPKARGAAQRGLTFLATEASAWSGQHGCFGCHVHAVTMEAFAVGKHNQYALSDAEVKTILTGMLTIPGGARGPVGLSYHDGSLLAPSKAFGGAAFARYDQWIGQDVRDDLLRTGKELLEYQDPDGSIRLDWVNPPVGAGVVQGTYQAAQTWRQIYARTADDKWLLPLQKAEHYLAGVARSALQTAPANIQDLNYAVMGLAAAGVGSGDDTIQSLAKLIVKRQHDDGGWGFTEGEGSGAFATGQALYALRSIGMVDSQSPIARGTSWLIDHQAQDGGWSHSGAGKAEAMWGVLGLVSVDVLSVAIKDLQDGDHVADKQTLAFDARDNDPKGGGVVKVELQIDDILVASSCGASLSYGWDTKAAEPGKHVVDLVATNASGQSARRRLELFAGPVYMTQVGSKSTQDRTELSLRDIAPKGKPHTIELQILSADEKTVIATLTKTGEAGANTLAWDGLVAGGAKAPSGKYVARLNFKDGKNTVQTEQVPFVRATEAEQHDGWGEVEGNLALPAGGAATNTQVQLIDDAGNVVQSTRTTASGQYRFKGVDQGKYKVRISKKGYDRVEAPVSATKATESKADLKLH